MDPEGGLSCRFLLRDLDVAHLGQRWTGAAPLDHGVDGIRIALEGSLHLSVRRVPDEPSQPERPGPSGGLGPEEDALDLTGDEEVDPLHREGTEPPVRFAPTAVIAPARSEAMNAAAFPTSSSDVSLFSRVFARIHATSSSRVMGCPVP